MPHNAKNSEDAFSFKCPSCGKGLVKMDKAIYDLPDGDKILIMKFECDECDFHNNDIIPLETQMEPGVLTLRITSEEDLKSKIYRSPTGKLEIPELEVSVEPGPRADFYYTNVEGILNRFESAVSIYINQMNKNDRQFNEIEKILKDLEKARNGKFEFTLILSDLIGGSYIIPVDKSKYTFKKCAQTESENDKDNTKDRI